MLQGRESKEGEEGIIDAGLSFYLNNIRVVSWGINLLESNHLWPAYRASRFQWIFAISSEVKPSIFQLLWYRWPRNPLSQLRADSKILSTGF